MHQFSGSASVSHISISLGVLLPTLRKASDAPALDVVSSLRVRSLQNPFIASTSIETVEAARRESRENLTFPMFRSVRDGA